MSIAAEPRPAVVPKATRRSWSNGAMYWIRRIHLYSGLFMFPWVMLYGVTALLFNHPGAFADRVQQTLERDDFQGTALEAAIDPSADAEQVVKALNAKLGSGQVKHVEPGRAIYSRDVIAARVRGPGQDHAVAFDIPSGSALVSTAAQANEQQAPFAMRGLKVPGSLSERVKSGLPKALAQRGLAADEAGIAQGSELVFFVEVEGKRWRAVYNIQTGAVTGSPAESAGDLTPRRFLTQLHLAHGYPSSGGIRWWWALSVDVMFVSMVFWGISGIFMWWQLKAVRVMGGLVLVTSLVVATLVALGMHRSLSGL